MSEGAENKQCCETSQWLWRRGWRAHVPGRYLTHAAPGRRERGGGTGRRNFEGRLFYQGVCRSTFGCLGGKGLPLSSPQLLLPRSGGRDASGRSRALRCERILVHSRKRKANAHDNRLAMT